MSADAPMPTVDDTLLASLSPAKRALLEQRLVRRREAGAGAIPQRRPDDVVPLTPGQRVLWLYDRIGANRAVYNMPDVFRVRGTLDIDSLQQALDTVIARHEALRTTIGGTESEPRQVVRPATSVGITVEDLRSVTGRAMRDAESKFITRISRTPFDLTADPPVRAALAWVGDGEYVFVLVTHHIVSDGWSRAILFRELSAAYAAAVHGATAASPRLPVQYGDYACWVERELQTDGMRRHLSYWQQRLAGELPSLELPTDRPRPTTMTGGGAVLRTLLSPAVRDHVNAYARANGATPFMVLLAAWLALLARHTGQTDIIVGTPVAGRTRSDVEDVIGYFVNTLPLRVSLDGAPQFDELVSRVRATVLDAFEHQDAPLELMRSDRERAGGQPLFRVLFGLQNHSPSSLVLEGATVQPEPGERLVTAFDLSLNAVERPDGLLVSLEYSTDLFDAETSDAMLRRYGVLLDGALVSPATTVGRLPLLPPAERDHLLNEWGRGPRGSVTAPTFDALFARRARTDATRPAIRCGAQVMTYAALDARAGAVAALLRVRGVRIGDFVGILMDRECDTIAAMLGVMRAGAAYVPLDLTWPRDRIAAVAADAALKLVITQPTHEALLGDVPMTTLSDLVTDASGIGAEPIAHGADDIAYMIYTSGSTGAPKGVLIPHRALVNYVECGYTSFPMTPDDVVIQHASFAFDASVYQIWMVLAAGAVVVLPRGGILHDPEALMALVYAERVTILTGTPAMLDLLVDTAHFRRCASLRCVLAGGEALSRPLADRIRSALPTAHLLNAYGPTETTVDATLWIAPASDTSHSIPIGRPIGNAFAYVLSAERELVPVGVTGELYVGGAGVAVGYHQRAALTFDRFITDPFSAAVGARMYRTGDCVRWRRDGQLEYLGRNDDQVKLRGIRVELGEIEGELIRLPGVARAAATVQQVDDSGARLIGYVVPTSGTQLDPRAMRAALRVRLPSTIVPSAIAVVHHIPLTSAGKIDQSALPVPSFVDDDELVLPRSDVEWAIARVWSDVLSLPHVGVESDFFAIGGHSLLAVRLVARLGQLLQTTLPLRTLFDAPTVAGMATTLTGDPALSDRVRRAATVLRRISTMTPAERQASRDAPTATPFGGHDDA